jgi:hypothetical protein
MLHDDAFEKMLTGEVEHGLCPAGVSFHENDWTGQGHRLKEPAALGQRASAEIFAVMPKDVECVEHRWPCGSQAACAMGIGSQPRTQGPEVGPPWSPMTTISPSRITSGSH